jgi:tRNA(Ile)-lysidine synthase
MFPGIFFIEKHKKGIFNRKNQLLRLPSHAQKFDYCFRMDFIRKVQRFSATHRLFPTGAEVLVALSGGADSVALLRVLLHMGVPCHAVHCNFHLRGDESNRDEQFVHSLCRTLDVPLYIEDFDTLQWAKEHRISIEMAARRLRYDAFERLRTTHGLQVVAVGHHLEDSVETVLFNLMRGTGIKGLSGIAPVNGHIVRPLLCVTRADIEAYLGTIGQTWVDDSSNASDDYARNRIRHRLLPVMKELNPAALQNIAATAEHLRGVGDLCESKASDSAAITVLHGVLHPYGYNKTQVTNLLEALRNRRQTLLPSGLHDEGTTLSAYLVTYDADSLPRSNRVLCLDVRQLQGATLTLRPWQKGDRFCPFGMKGRTKLVSDLLTDLHLSRYERSRQQVLCVNDTIAWVVGRRSDERFRVPADADEILVIEMK